MRTIRYAARDSWKNRGSHHKRITRYIVDERYEIHAVVFTVSQMTGTWGERNTADLDSRRGGLCGGVGGQRRGGGGFIFQNHSTKSRNNGAI